MKTIIADAAVPRLDVFVAERAGLSRSQVKSLLDHGLITLTSGGKPVSRLKAGSPVKTGDIITLDSPATRGNGLEPEDIALQILYEDKWLIVVDKPQGMAVHPGAGRRSGTLANALLGRAGGLSDAGGADRPGIVHRLDKNTSGVMVVAKNNEAHRSLAAQIAEKSAVRTYRAILTGIVKEDTGRIETLLARSKNDRKKMTVVADGGRRAATLYKVLCRGQGHTYAEFVLETGRTHQIRVHAAYINRPVACDPEYGVKSSKLGHVGQLLHSYTLSFDHPATGERLSFTAPLPLYFLAALQKLEMNCQ
ncbi:MAG: RluA family pseudouridine synthase [Firmicutes bacterium]|nr:RluA family pseudouridine synthase [Bacillota bacterium]